MFKSLFKNDKLTPEQEKALNAANMALQVRINRLVHEAPMDSYDQGKVTDKFGRRVFEGRAAA